MKKIVILGIGALVMVQGFSQKKSLLPTAKEDIYYYVEGEGGANSLSISYNEEMQLYYMAMAGNAAFPLEVFNTSGKNIYNTNTKVDMRGFWYNPKTKKIQGTKYGGGAYTMLVDDKGYPGGTQFTSKDENFKGPSEQATAVCNLQKKEIYCYQDQFIYVYNQNNFKLKKKIELKNSPVEWFYVNPYSMIYTGVSGYEFGLWDVVTAQVLFFNTKGEYVAASYIPGEPPYAEYFCFAFCNDRVWLFENEKRIWYSYIIFQ